MYFSYQTKAGKKYSGENTASVMGLLVVILCLTCGSVSHNVHRVEVVDLFARCGEIVGVGPYIANELHSTKILLKPSAPYKHHTCTVQCIVVYSYRIMPSCHRLLCFVLMKIDDVKKKVDERKVIKYTV